jgi:hypothetical protein
MARGNARQNIVHDDGDRQRLVDDLARTVGRSDWQFISLVVLSNHLRQLLKTPRPNLARGMQAFLSAYAIYAARRRRRRSGHLFQRRYQAEMIEDSRRRRPTARRSETLGRSRRQRWRGSSGGVVEKPRTKSESFLRRDQCAMAITRLGFRSAGLAFEGARKLFKKAMIAWRSTDGRDSYARVTGAASA